MTVDVPRTQDVPERSMCVWKAGSIVPAIFLLVSFKETGVDSHEPEPADIRQWAPEGKVGEKLLPWRKGT